MNQWFKGFRLKMLILVSVSFAVIVAIAGYSLIQFRMIAGKLEEANQQRTPLAQWTNQMATHLNGADRYLWNSIAEANPVTTIKMGGLANEEIDGFDNSLEEAAKLPMNAFMTEKIKEIQEKWPQLKTAYGQVVLDAAKSTPEGDKAAREGLIKSKDLSEEITDIIVSLNDNMTASLKAATEEDHAFIVRLEQVMTAVSGVALLFIFGFGIYIARQIVKVLSGAIHALSLSSREVSWAAEGLSASATQLSSGSTQTASSLEETVSSAEELSSTVRKNADNAREAAALANGGKRVAQTGEDHISKLYEAVGEVSSSSKQIEDIITVIDDIAFQTNLLALNAAVEAARAGEQGRGFAVVAEAVRSLAQRSAVAAKDISGLIHNSVARIELSRDLAEQGKKSLSEIVSAIMKIADINDEIATASEEQAVGLGSISKAMNEIDRASQQNAATSEEISATSEELTAQSEGLKSQINDLIILVEGQSDQILKVNQERAGMKMDRHSDHHTDGHKAA